MIRYLFVCLYASAPSTTTALSSFQPPPSTTQVRCREKDIKAVEGAVAAAVKGALLMPHD